MSHSSLTTPTPAFPGSHLPSPSTPPQIPPTPPDSDRSASRSRAIAPAIDQNASPFPSSTHSQQSSPSTSTTAPISSALFSTSNAPSFASVVAATTSNVLLSPPALSSSSLSDSTSAQDISTHSLHTSADTYNDSAMSSPLPNTDCNASSLSLPTSQSQFLASPNSSVSRSTTRPLDGHFAEAGGNETDQSSTSSSSSNDSDEVEVFLSALSLDNSISYLPAAINGTSNTTATPSVTANTDSRDLSSPLAAVEDTSILPPSFLGHAQFLQHAAAAAKETRNTDTVHATTSGQSPPIPVPSAPPHQTIPLPTVDSDNDNEQDRILGRRCSVSEHPLDTQFSFSGAPRGAVGTASTTPTKSRLKVVTTSFEVTSTTPSNFDSKAFRSNASLESPIGAIAAADTHSDTTNGMHKTPNVYINGLPPHFPEDQLFELAAQFGEIRSVRTFTRHVRESESGYGFVLFETVEAAERCIISLRRYRNLHPTFSKQIHKIPGTSYATQPKSTLDSSVSVNTPTSSLAGWEQESADGGCVEDGADRDGGVRTGVDASFKAKMESLRDETSTNLYMEGLPLSIDEPTLAALVSPHKINSSRFFQTRLSNPPRIIAFVRLETRQGAEEIIERLHGRMVRGWNDTGSRISVRFADTSEQRELRRHERLAKDGGDQSPARLTIAQAALLNLRGKELEAELGRDRRQATGPVIHAHPQAHSHSQSRSFARRGGHVTPHHHSVLSPFSSNATHLPPHNEFLVDYTLPPIVPSRTHTPSGHHTGLGQYVPNQQYLVPTPSSISSSAYHPRLQQQYQQAQPVDPAMTALLASLRNNGTPFHTSQGYAHDGDEYAMYPSHDAHVSDYHPALHQQQQQQHLSSLRMPAHHNVDGGEAFDPEYTSHLRPHLNLQSQLHAQGQSGTGYTATEEFIMRAHAEANHHSQRRGRPPPLELNARQHAQGQAHRRRESDAQVALGLRGYRTLASAVSLPAQQRQAAFTSGAAEMAEPPVGMGMMNEDDFHASAPGAGIEYGGGRQVRHGQVVSEGNGSAVKGSMVGKQGHNYGLHPAHVNARLSRDPTFSQQQAQQQTQEHIHSHNQNQNQQQQQLSNRTSIGNGTNNSNNYQQAHMRATTLPHRSAPANQHQRHYQHSSMSSSMPVRTTQTQNQTQKQTQQHNNSGNSNNGNINRNANDNGSIMNKNITISDPNSIYDDDDRSDGIITKNIYDNSKAHFDHHPHAIPLSLSRPYHDSLSSKTNSNMYDLDQDQRSPSMISPALTYSSQSQTPSTLSPATPFFGSFGNQEGFQSHAQGDLHVLQHAAGEAEVGMDGALRSGSH